MKTASKHTITVFNTVQDLNLASAHLIVKLANDAIESRGRFTIVLSGGNTPLKLYSLLAHKNFRNKIPWEKVFIFWGDERCVPLNSTQNNAYQAKRALLQKLHIPAGNLHIIRVDLIPHIAAVTYEQQINLFFAKKAPRFDLILLGLGENGHTASLFPDKKTLHEHAAGIRDLYVKEEKQNRITMTAPLINMARNVLFMAIGKNKATTLKKVLTGPYRPDKYPAQLIRPGKGNLIWFVDSEAAKLILR